MSQAFVKKKRLDIDGVLLLDKPAGISSNDALIRAKRIMNAKKAGHTGTLDPFVIEWLTGSGSTLAETFRLFTLCIVPFLLCNGFSGNLGNGIPITKTFEPLDTDKDKGRNDENKKNDLSQTFVVSYKLKHGGLCPFKKMRLK